jgi:peptide-methionine (S)-S-oxide reductase
MNLYKLLYPFKLSALLLLLIVQPGLSQAAATQQKETTHYQTATFAGGCFWCIESDFDKVPGVTETVSGYIGGHQLNPTYKQVTAGTTGHTEAVQITFDSKIISYEKLLTIFWHKIDPTTVDRQFCDRGSQYRTAIFYHNAQQMKHALDSKSLLEKTKPFKADIVTKIEAASRFYPAEEYHQDYHHKNPVRYRYYRYGCGRDKRLQELWG